MAPYDTLYGTITRVSDSIFREQEIQRAISQLSDFRVPNDELYHDPDRLTVRSRHQDMEISDLKRQLSAVKEKKAQDLKNLVAYYYKRS